MRVILLLLLVALTISQITSDNVYPDIQDLFPQDPETATIKDLDIDLERIDMDKFMKSLDALEAQLTGNETRRQQFQFYNVWQYKRASRYIVKIKSCDLSLQAIYMTRHRVRQLENEKHFNKNDTGYRVAFLYRTLRRLWRRIMDLVTIAQVKKDFTWWHTDLKDNFQIHGKIIKLYEEFQYLYWVLIRVDGHYLRGLRTTRAAGTTQQEALTRGTRTRTTTTRTTIDFGQHG